MAKTLERQYLIEAETKLEAMEARFMAHWPEQPSKSEIQERNRLCDYIEQLKKELGI